MAAKPKTAEQPETDLAAIAPPLNKIGSRKKKAVEEHTVITTYRNEVPINPPAQKARKAAPVVEEFEDEDVEDDDFDSLPEELAAFLRERGDSMGDISMEVRLVDRKAGTLINPRDGVYLGTYSFNVGTYLDDLALYCAETGKVSEFTIRLKQDGQYLPKGAIQGVRVVGATVERKVAAGVIQQPPAMTTTFNQTTLPVQQPQPQTIAPPLDIDAEFKKRLEWVNEFEKMAERRYGTQREQPQTIAPVDPEVSTIQLLMKDPDTAKRIASGISGLIGGEIAKESVTEMLVGGLINILQSAAPSIIPQAANYFQVKTQIEQLKLQQLQQQMGAPTTSNGTHAEQPQSQLPPQPEPEHQAPQQEAIPQPDEILFGRVLYLCGRRKIVTPEAAKKDIFAMIDAETTPPGFFDGAVEIFLSVEAKTLVEFAAQQSPIAAALAQQEDVPAWIEALQGEIKKEWAQDEQATVA